MIMGNVPPAIPESATMEAALRFLGQRTDYERGFQLSLGTAELNLDRMRELLARVGHPHLGMPVVHVAGTKGKGSTAAMIAAVLTAAGYRTGLFTSPHLDRAEERIAIDGRACSAAQFVCLLERLRPVVEAMDAAGAKCFPAEAGPTYFEIVTAMAFLHFAEAKVDLAVLEVGLGGRLDSTNVCGPAVSVITSISLDHTQQLGDTLESIAREKAGIIKPGVPVVSGVTEPGPREVIRKTCQQRGCRLAELGVDFEFFYSPPRGLESAPAMGTIDFRDRDLDYVRSYDGVAVALLGRHQGANAAVALATLGRLARLGWVIPESAMREGLARLTWPARIELIARRPAVVIDAAHNVASVDALMEVLDESFSPRQRILVFATTREKDVRGMLQRLLGQFDQVILTRYSDNPRALALEDLAAAATAVTGREYRLCARPADAWDAARALATPDDLICVTGSFYLAAQMRQEVLSRPCADGGGG